MLLLPWLVFGLLFAWEALADTTQDYYKHD